MSNGGSLQGPENPTDFPQVEPQAPTELFPTTNIRWVISETAKLTERVEVLRASSDKVFASLEKIADRQAAALKDGFEKQAADIKERFETAAKPVDELRADMKEVRAELREIDKTISWAKGSLKTFSVIGGLLIIVLSAVFAALARKLIG